MNNKFYLFLLIGLLIIYYINCLESINIKEEFNLNQRYLKDKIDYGKLAIKKYNYKKVSPFIDLNSFNTHIKKLSVIAKGDTLELLDLPYCDGTFEIEYTNNISPIVNSQNKIYQNIENPLEQNVKINNEPHNLYQISWRKSFFTYDKIPIDLELHFSHVNPLNSERTSVIFPQISVKSDIFTETFDNINKLINKTIDKTIDKTIKKINISNILIKSKEDIPKFILGQNNTGKLLNSELCEISKLLLNHKEFYYAKTSSNERLLIARPQPIDESISNSIKQNLTDPDYEILK